MNGIHVFGCDGWLGRKIVTALKCRPAPLRDIAHVEDLERWLNIVKPHTVINAAGRAGPPSYLRGKPGIPQNIDWCSLNEETRAETGWANIVGPLTLGRECTKRGIKVVHLSSGCLWNGPSPHADGAWRETDEPNPVSYYSSTKVEGELALMRECGAENEPLIIRIRLPISGDMSGRNLIMKLRRYPEVIDVVNSVTVVRSFLFAMERLIREERTGIYHVTNPGPVSHREIMDWYCELVDPEHQNRYEIVPEEEIFNLGRAIDGRSSCILNTDKLQRAGIQLGDARRMVRDCMRELRRAMDDLDDDRSD